METLISQLMTVAISPDEARATAAILMGASFPDRLMEIDPSQFPAGVVAKLIGAKILFRWGEIFSGGLAPDRSFLWLDKLGSDWVEAALVADGLTQKWPTEADITHLFW